jgi:hypothetical protein
MNSFAMEATFYYEAMRMVSSIESNVDISDPEILMEVLQIPNFELSREI